MLTPTQHRRITGVSTRLGPVAAAAVILALVSAPAWAYGILTVFAVLAIAAIIATWNTPQPA